MSDPDLNDIAAATMAADGKIPLSVLDAFLPRTVTHVGQKLVPLTAGHELLLSQVGHPLATGEPWADIDVLMALFLFSRPSRQLFSLIADDSFEAAFFEFIDTIPRSDIGQLGKDMAAHWLRGRNTALAMESPHPGSTQKKTEVSDGGSPLLGRLARSTAGLQTWLSTTFR